jgi:hypothetical protein
LILDAPIQRITTADTPAILPVFVKGCTADDKSSQKKVMYK